MKCAEKDVSSCDGSGTTDTAVCTSTSAVNFTNASDTDEGSTNELKCGPGQYLNGNECVDCKTSCSDDQYLSDACDKEHNTHDAECKACTISSTCGGGQYLKNRCIASEKPVTNTAVCSACNLECPNGESLMNPCQGTETSLPLASCEPVEGSVNASHNVSNFTNVSDASDAHTRSDVLQSHKNLTNDTNGSNLTDTEGVESSSEDESQHRHTA